MLIELHIRDFAVIEKLDVEFKPGMTVFTGETGAGKSIVVDAMGLLMGDRADSSIIRSGQNKTEITAHFSITKESEIRTILDEQEIELDDELLIRRLINKDGRSKAFLNGCPAPMQLLRHIGEYLVDIHGQHAHQSLLRKDKQRQLLDDFAEHGELLSQLNDHHQNWFNIRKQLEQLSGNDEGREAQLSLLKYQVDELETLNFEENEFSELEEEFKRLNSAAGLIEAVEKTLFNLSDSDDHASIRGLVNQHLQELTELETRDARVKVISDLLNNAQIQLEEATHEARDYLSHTQIDPQRLLQVENRMTVLHDMARKHHIKPEQLCVHYEHLKTQLDDMQGGEARYQELLSLSEQSEDAYNKTAETLHQSRVSAGEKLSKAIIEKLNLLGMSGGQFEVSINYQKDIQPQKNGLDTIEFVVSANPGQALKPIGKVASGGELSRISLAIQVISHKDKSVPTFVFDEVDAGIGGATAEIVGQLLHSLTDENQIFCVTHLPQVASYGDQHFHVSKTATRSSTHTEVSELDQKQRIDEIARMLGGLNITDKSRAHAKEMLQAKKQHRAA